MPATIALVDDDRNILTSVSIALQSEGFTVRVYSDGEAALKALIDNPPDLAVLDIKMPKLDGMELLRRLREKSAVPAIFLTSKDDELDEALGLAMGADDYITKPFSQRLLIARIRAILRRTDARAEPEPEEETTPAEKIVRGRLAMDPARHRVQWAGQEVTLTVTEFLILEALAQRPGFVKSRDQLMDAAYQDDVYVDDRTIDSHIKRLRRKFRQVDPEFKAIETLYGVGIALRRNDERDLALVWSSRWSLTTRILAVNIFALAMLAGGFFYLDSYRSQLNDARLAQAATQASLIAEALDAAPADRRQELVDKLERTSELRLRVYDRSGDRVLDSWSTGAPTYVLRDPDQESWERKAARTLDRMIDIVVGADKPARFAEPERDILSAWPEALAAAESGKPETQLRRAPDRTPVISAAAPMHDSGMTLLATTNARDIVRIVRAERFRLGIVLAMVITVSVLLSLFLARTIVRPLRRLARAAHRVRLGRAREVQVPRLPDRRDEIGLLARALSDMSLALRQRIDATEAFAADVTHELKNPLASLRSAVETLERVKDPALQKQLLDVVHDDVHRLDRLITDIADASRLDAELSRARFETIDLGQMIEGLVEARERRGTPSGVRLAFARPHAGTAVVHGDGARLTRVIENLVDNAISFSPPGALVKIAATRDGDEVVVRVDDEGPGVAPDVREAIFKRFHSIRPEGEAFGQHSGLGLAIAKAIVDAHNGTIMVEDRDDAPRGARFIIRLPVAER